MTVRRSLAYSAADSYLSVLLQLAGTVIIARLLTPTETGVFAVAAVFAALAGTFRDFGVAEYMIQVRHARGSLVAFVEHDDYWHPHKLSSQIAVLEQHGDVGVVYGGFVRWDPSELPAFPEPNSWI